MENNDGHSSNISATSDTQAFMFLHGLQNKAIRAGIKEAPVDSVRPVVPAPPSLFQEDSYYGDDEPAGSSIGPTEGGVLSRKMSKLEAVSPRRISKLEAVSPISSWLDRRHTLRNDVDEFLEEPIIYTDNSLRNMPHEKEEEQIRIYRRKFEEAIQLHQTSPKNQVKEGIEKRGGDYYGSEDGEDNGEKHGHGEASTGSFDIGTGEHVSIETGVGMKFAWKSPVQAKSGLVKGTATQMNPTLKRISKAREMPFYASQEYMALHYNPATRPAVLDSRGFVPIFHAASVSKLLQRDVTDALIVLSAQGDENKNVFGEAGFTEELLNLVESPDMEVRCNSAKSLANLMSQEQNRRAFFAIPRSVERFNKIAQAKTLDNTRVQPGTVRAMRSVAEAMSQLANAETKETKQEFMDSGMIKTLGHLSRSKDKETRMHAARGLLHLCRKPGCHGDKWQRPTEMTNVTWTSEQLAILVNAADSQDPEVVLQVLLGTRSVCTPSYISIMLGRTNILSMLVKAMKGNLFRENFPLLMAAVLVLSTLSQTAWSKAVLEGDDFHPILKALLDLMPKTQEQVLSMQSAKGVMSTWDEATLAQKARILTHSPEATMGAVAEVFPQSFRQLQCYLLVGDVLEVMETLMLNMEVFRVGFFHHGAAQHFINLHLYTRYKIPQVTCLRLLCLMVGSQKLAPEVSKNARLLDIIDFALRSEEHASLPKTSVISIRELSKNKDCVQQLIQRGLVQALGTLTKTSDPLLQLNLIISLRNLSCNLLAKESIVQLPQWPKIVRWAESFDPLVRKEIGLLFAEICSGADSEICRTALTEVVKEFKSLIRQNKIDPATAQTVVEFVNETKKIVKAQSLFRGVITRRRCRILLQRKADLKLPPPTSSVQRALAVFSPPQKIPENLRNGVTKDRIDEGEGKEIALQGEGEGLDQSQ